jgi:predicted tellurium resistance membrane protein TerC
MDLTVFFNGLFSLLTLTFLELVLAVDNLVFIAILSGRLPLSQQKMARRLGLLLALITRLLLLATVVWIIGLKHPLFFLWQWSFSARDLLLIGGGMFLLYKTTVEIHTEFEPPPQINPTKKFSSLIGTILQIAILDIIFSLDSVFTAVGMTHNYTIMASAIIIAIAIMILASEFLSRFINHHPTIRMLALSFLLLIGVLLIADGLHFYVPKGYVYFAICFSLFVEIMNALKRRKQTRN